MRRFYGTDYKFCFFLPTNKLAGYNIDRPYRTFNPLFALFIKP
jgi:hypothetical protein